MVTLIYANKTYIKKNLERNRNLQNCKITVCWLERNSLLYMLMRTNGEAIILVSHNFLSFRLTQLNNFLTFIPTYFVLTIDLLTLPLISILQYPMPILKFISRIVLVVVYDSAFFKTRKAHFLFLNLMAFYVKQHHFII